jgi:hypothetical protein
MDGENYTHIMEYNSVFKKKATWVKLEDIMLSVKSQPQKTLHDSAYLRNLKR